MTSSDMTSGIWMRKGQVGGNFCSTDLKILFLLIHNLTVALENSDAALNSRLLSLNLLHLSESFYDFFLFTPIF